MSVPPSRVRPACACARARAAAAAAARGSARLLFPEFLQRRLQHALRHRRPNPRSDSDHARHHNSEHDLQSAERARGAR
eukprot:3055314-Rhodomonas_salina.1